MTLNREHLVSADKIPNHGRWTSLICQSKSSIKKPTKTCCVCGFKYIEVCREAENIIQTSVTRRTSQPNQPCTIMPLAASLIRLLCLKRLSINSIAATEYRFSGPFLSLWSSVFAIGDTGVISSTTCSLQSSGEVQTGCVNNGLAFIGEFGPGGLALAKTRGLNGAARGLMAL